MTSDRWTQIEHTYHAAVERRGAEQTALLDELCAGDAELRLEVQALLDTDRRAAIFLERPALEEEANALAREQGPSLTIRQLGGYRVLELLGAGGAGHVYRAKDLKLGREVALKVLVRSAAGDADYLRRFEEEARIASGLNHPNIVTIYGVGEDDELLYIAMELVRGRTLRELLAGGALPVQKALEVAAPLAEGLAAAHHGGIVHLDLKPENVMVTPEGLVKVLDFGLAKRQTPQMQAGFIEDGMIRGTLDYMSPEQAAGRPADGASDQFSFGVILHEMLSGTRAFERATTHETLAAIIGEPPRSIDDLHSGVPAALQQVVGRCLAKDPANRYADTRVLAVALRRIAAQAAPNTPEMTRRRAIWLGGAVAVAAVGGVATWRLWPRGLAIKSLAVLPFMNAAGDEETDYLGDGITESLIQRISRIPSLRVIARSTVFNFKGKAVDPLGVGRRLGVDSVLSGTVARRTGRLLITAELVDVTTGAQLWSNTYDRAAADVLLVQDEIASAIVDEGIRVRLSGDDRSRLARHPTDDPEAYELYLRAVHQHRQENERGYLSARELLQQAIARDAKFALAYAALAATYVVMAVDGFERPTDVQQHVNRNVRQALALDPDLANAHAEAASEAFFFNWDWAGADREWKTAMRSRNGDFEPDSLLGYSLQRWALGRPDEALELARTARGMDPISPTFAVREADLLFHTGQLDASADLFEKVIHDEPDDPRPYFGLAEVRRAQQRFDDAIEARRKGRAAAGDDVSQEQLPAAGGAEGFEQSGRMMARVQLDALRIRAAEAYVSPLDFARAHAQTGEKDQAFGYFPAAFADRASGLVFLKVDRAWDPIRDDGRFLAAVERVGLP
jgi:eukaryotic-like serine/threonine-protein kinase